MDRINTSTAVVDLFGAGKNGFRDGNKSLGIVPTDLNAQAFNGYQEELMGVIEGAGLTPNGADFTQLRQAITTMIQSGQRAVIIDGAMFSPAVAGTGKAVYWDQANTRFDLALADGTAKQNMVGFADVANSKVYAFGSAVLFAGLTPGRYYLDGTTAGAITLIAPSNAVAVGSYKSATEMFVDIDAIGGSAQQPGEICYFAMNAAPPGFLKANGAAVSRTTYAALFAAICPTYGAVTSISNGAGAVVNTPTAHGKVLNDPVSFTTTGALPTGLTAGTTYYVAGTVASTSFQLSATIGGATIATSSAGTGTHTLISNPFGIPVGDIANFLLPDLRGEFLRGWDDARGVDSGRVFGSWQADNFKSHAHALPGTIQVVGGGSAYGVLMQSGSQDTGASGGTETRGRNIALLACIKY